MPSQLEDDVEQSLMESSRVINKRLLGIAALSLAPLCLNRQDTGAPQVQLQRVAPPSIEYFGHACVRIESPRGVRVLIDPYMGGGFPEYKFPEGLINADVLLVTHQHSDHNFGGDPLIQMKWGDRIPTLYDGEAVIGDVRLTGVVGRHSQGVLPGQTTARDPDRVPGMKNVIWMIEVAGLRIAHWGDNEPITEDLKQRLGHVDILMLPIDAGHHLLSDDDVAEIREAISPHVVIPIHYRILELEPDLGEVEPNTDWNGWGPLEPWLESQSGVVRLDMNAFSITATQSLPRDSVLVFKWPTPNSSQHEK